MLESWYNLCLSLEWGFASLLSRLHSGIQTVLRQAGTWMLIGCPYSIESLQGQLKDVLGPQEDRIDRLRFEKNLMTTETGMNHSFDALHRRLTCTIWKTQQSQSICPPSWPFLTLSLHHPLS
jgi:hypothetical protein